MRYWPVTCGYCKASLLKPVNEVNRAERKGSPMYCDKTCFGLSRRVEDLRTSEQRKADKAAYDRQYREDNREWRKWQKAEYHKKTYDQAKAREVRKLRMPYHVEYCRKPEYKAKKKQYDRTYRAEKQFGAFSSAFLALQNLETEIRARASKYEIYSQNGTLNKCLQRKRNYVNAI